MRFLFFLLASLGWALLAGVPASASPAFSGLTQEQGTQPSGGPEKPAAPDSLSASPLHQMFEGLLQSLYGTRRAAPKPPAELPCEEEEQPEERPGGKPQEGL